MSQTNNEQINDEFIHVWELKPKKNMVKYENERFKSKIWTGTKTRGKEKLK